MDIKCFNNFELYKFKNLLKKKNNIIFKYDEQEIKIVWNINDIYFNTKNVLNILEYKDYEVELNKKTEFYLNEEELYNIILNSKSEKKNNFQKYIYVNLIPFIKKIIYETLIKEKNVSDKKLCKKNILIKKKNNLIDKQNNLIDKQNKLIDKQTNKILFQIKHIKNIQEDLEDLEKELDTCTIVLNEITQILNRKIIEKDNEINLYYLNKQYLNLYLKDNKYYFLLGNINDFNKILKIKKIDAENIIIDLTKVSKSFNFINKLNEISKSKNRLLKRNITQYIRNKYPNISYYKFNLKCIHMFNKKKIFEICDKELILNSSKIEYIIELYNEFLNEI